MTLDPTACQTSAYSGPNRWIQHAVGDPPHISVFHLVTPFPVPSLRPIALRYSAPEVGHMPREGERQLFPASGGSYGVIPDTPPSAFLPWSRCEPHAITFCRRRGREP